MKLCKKCNTVKPDGEFHNSRQRKDGLYPYCKICTNTYMRNHQSQQSSVDRRKQIHQIRQNDSSYRAAAKRRSDKFYGSMRGRAMTLIAGAKRRDPNASVSVEHVMRLLQQGHCPVTNIPFVLTTDFRASTGKTYNPYAPSLDRIEPSKGYTDQNTRLVIWQYNLMKGELSDAEIFLICNAVVQGAIWI